jgi:UDP-2-acetamido-3-amino-2,3-dideoxy-glucuronate N-acetyltransferase
MTSSRSRRRQEAEGGQASAATTTPLNPADTPTVRIAPDVKLGRDVKIYAFVNLYGCSIGDETRIGTFVEIQKNASVGARCKISSHTFICEGVTIEDEVFVGHGVTFINDLYPRATAEDGKPQTEADWQVVPTVVKRGASIGSGATLLGGITIGERAIVGAGAVVTRDVPPDTTVAGNPARVLRSRKDGGQRAEVG